VAVDCCACLYCADAHYDGEIHLAAAVAFASRFDGHNGSETTPLDGRSNVGAATTTTRR